MVAKSTVSLMRCSCLASDDYVADKVVEAIDMLPGMAQKFQGKTKILIKANMANREHIRFYKLVRQMRDPTDDPNAPSRQISLTDVAVLEGTVKWLRKQCPGAEIYIGDGFVERDNLEEELALMRYDVRLAPYDVQFVKLCVPPFADYQVPGKPLMFKSYNLHKLVGEADAHVSVAKMKLHPACGVTLTVKNLFGLPTPIYAHPRRYLHAPIRLPRVLVDLQKIFNTDLAVLDGVIASNRICWGGDPLASELVLAGDNAVATDVVAMHLMELDPHADYPTIPFYWEQSHLRLAAHAGLGPLDLEGIELKGGNIEAMKMRFAVDRRMPAEQTERIRQDTVIQARYFFENREKFLDKYRGQFLGIAGKEVVYSVPDLLTSFSRGQAMRDRQRQRMDPWAGGAFFLARAIPKEEEQELEEVYFNLEFEKPHAIVF